MLSGLNLLPRTALPEAWEQMTHVRCLVGPDDAEQLTFLAGKSAIYYRRKQPGMRPLRRLVHQT